jgi:hypothetical protein
MDEMGAFLSAALGQAPGTGTGDPPPLVVAISGWLEKRFGIVLPFRIDDHVDD